MKSRALIAILLASLPAAHGAGERLTARCNTHFGTGEIFVTTQREADLVRAIAGPQPDPDTFHRLWRPNAVSYRSIGERSYVALRFDRIQDTQQIATEIQADPVLWATFGVSAAWAYSDSVCFITLPGAPRVVVTEYLNRHTGHYFLSSSPAENAAIDGGQAGPGWERTGETFATIPPSYCHKSRPVFRFYGPGPNSHFFTPDTLECAGLREPASGWLYEGEAFGASLPVDGACPSHMPQPVYRAYNNRWMHNDSNHRFTTRFETYRAMVDKGWIGEGIGLCIPAN